MPKTRWASLGLVAVVKGGRGFGSSDSPIVEFGLAKAPIVDRVEIRWPGGTKQVLESVPVNRRIFVRERVVSD